MSKDSITQQDAAFQESVIQQWRDWRLYLTAHRTLLEVRESEQMATFEQTDNDVCEEEARQILAAIPAAKRQIFDAERENTNAKVQGELDAERRQAGGKGGVDPDEVDRQSLTVLLDECEGLSSEDDRGAVPMGDNTWYSVDTLTLLDTPAEASYQIKGGPSDKQRMLLVGGGLIGFLLFMAWWFLGGGSTPSLPNFETNEVMVNGLSLESWQLSEAVLVAPDRSETPIDLEGVDSELWPPSPPADARDSYGAWNEDQIWPLRACVPGAELERGITEVHLLSQGDTPSRIYALRDEPPGAGQGQIDLIITPCGSADPEHYGSIQVTPALPSYTIGQEIESEDLPFALTVQSMQIAGPGQDPTIAREQARVRVSVLAPEGIDWASYAPTLLLASGQELLPASTEVDDDQVVFRYLIPMPATPTIDVAWRITTPEEREVYRWRTTLAKPPVRDMVLRQDLSVMDVQVEQTDNAGASTVPVEVEIDLENRADLPIIITASDIVLQEGGQQVPLPDLEGITNPIPAGEQRTVSFQTTLNTDGGDVVLTVGTLRFQIEVTTE